MRTGTWIGLGSMLFALACCVSSVQACGPSAPPTSAELLTFQTGIIERGLQREATLTEAQRNEIARLRSEVEAAHKADRRADARAAMQKIVAMFTTKEMMGAVEPIVPGCGPARAPMIKGTLLDIAIEPNRPGARCGNHYVLTIKEEGASGKLHKLNIYDLAKAPYASLQAMLRKTVEADTMGSSIIGIRLGTPGATAALVGLSSVRPC